MSNQASGNIKTTIIHPNGQTRTVATIPIEVEVNRLVRALSANIGLPNTGPKGPIVYRLAVIDNHSNERELEPTSTLKSAKVEEGSQLRLYSEMQAG